MIFLKPGALVIADRLTTLPGVEKIWQLDSPLLPVPNGDTFLLTGGASSLALFPVLPLDAAPGVADWTALDADMNGGFQLQLRHSSAGGSSLFLNVISVDGAVSSASSSGAPGASGVEVTFADGSSALVRFTDAGPGGALQLRAAGGAILDDVLLGPGVAVLPEWLGDRP